MFTSNKTIEEQHKKVLIYKITSPSGRVYIGQTINTLEYRLKQHKNKHASSTILHNSFDKYGYDSHKFETLYENLSIEEGSKKEKLLIKFYKDKNKSLNIHNGGRGGNGYRKETHPEFYEKLRQKRLGCKHTEKSKKLISIKRGNKVHWCYKWLIRDPKGNIFEIENLQHFCKKNNLNVGTMYYVYSGKRKHHKGYWCKRIDKNVVLPQHK